MPPASPETTSAPRIASSSDGLAVIDMAHDRDHRRTRLQRLGGIDIALRCWMSTSASLTRLMLWPNSVTSSSAVSWSIVSLTVTGMPILNSDLTRSAPRSAMRLASSPTVIASGTIDVADLLGRRAGLHDGRAFPSRGRACSAARQRARASPSSPSARVTVSLPRSRRCSLAAARRARRLGPLGGGAWPWPWRWRRGRSSSSSAAARRRRRRLRRRGSAARRRPPPRRRGGRPRRASSSALRLSSARRFSSSVAPWPACSSRRRASSSAVQPRFLGLAQQLLLQLLRGRRRHRPGARRASARAAARARGDRRRRAATRLRLRRLGLARAAEDAALLDLDHDGVRAAVAEALLHLAGLDRALEAQRRARSQLRLVSRLAHSKSFIHNSSAEAPGASAVAALSPSSRPIKARHRPSAWLTRAAAARSMMATCTTFSRPSANDNMALASRQNQAPARPLPSASRPTRQAWSSLRRPSALASAAWSSSATSPAPRRGLDLLGAE